MAYVPTGSTTFQEPMTAQQLRLMTHALAARSWAAATAVINGLDDVQSLGAAPGNPLVFNLCYGLEKETIGASIDQPTLATLFERVGLDLVGTGAAGQEACQDKDATSAIALELGVSVPASLTLEDAVARGVPVVVKPRRGAAHRRVRLVTDPAVLREDPPRSDDLIQEYLDGPEYSVAVLADPDRPCDPERLEVLPVVRIRYGRRAHEPRLYDWATTTWAPDSPRRFGLGASARKLFTCLGLTDYARFDFRVVRGRGPVLLDANALPSLAPRQLFATSARWGGISYPSLICRIAASASVRHRR